MTETTSSRGFTRRSFIKGVAAVTAAGALVGCTPKEDDKQSVGTGAADTQIYCGVCRGNCYGGCKLDVHVRDGQVVRTTAGKFPDSRFDRICTKGLTHVERIYGPERLQYPMKRIGERGAGEFERITWEEAIEEIAEKWSSYISDFGPESVATLSGSGNYCILNGKGLPANALDVFRNILGLSSIGFNVDMASGRADVIAYGGGVSSWTANSMPDILNSKYIICWGSNPVVSQIHNVHFIREAQELGAKYIVVDPVFNANAAKADKFIPINATTDGILAMGMINAIIENGWEKREFIKAHTEAPYLVKDSDGMFLRMSDLGVEPAEGEESPIVVWDGASGKAVALAESSDPTLEGVTEVDGIAVRTVFDIIKSIVAEYPLSKVAQITGVSEDDAMELTKIYAGDEPVHTYSQLGLDHYNNGHYSYWPLKVLAWFCEQVGRPGASCGLQSNVPANICNFAILSPADAAGNLAPGAGREIPVVEVGNVLDSGKFAGTDLTLKSCYFTYVNTAALNVDHAYTDSWLKKLDFVVVADMSMTETARYADILLPAAHWFEHVDMFTSCHNHPYAVWQDKCIEPLYESKTDYEIYKLILDKMGKGEFFSLTEEQFIEQWTDNDVARGLGITLENMKENKCARLWEEEVLIPFEGGVTLRPSGRLCLYQEIVTPDYNIGQAIDESKERTLYWEPAREATAGGKARGKHPFHLISEHMRTRTHSQFWDCKSLGEVEPGPVVKLNPEDAAEIGVEDGDLVKIFNDRGYVVMTAAISAGYPRGTCGALRSYQGSEFVEGHYAALPPREFNQVCPNQAFNDVAVSIEKY